MGRIKGKRVQYSLVRYRLAGERAIVFATIISLLISSLPFIWSQQSEATPVSNGTGKGLLVYSDSTTTPKKRQWNFGNTGFGSEASTATWDDLFQTVVKTSPIYKDFWLVVVNDASGNLTIKTSSNGGSTWDAGPTVTGIGGSGTTRRFDAAIEQQSGDLIIVYSKNALSNEVGIRRCAMSTGCNASADWDTEATVDLSNNTLGVVTFVELESKSNSDEIAAGFLTDQAAASNLYGAIWDGSSNAFGNQSTALVQCDPTTLAGDTKCFDVNYETGSGRPMINMGIGGGVRFARWDGTNWSAVISVSTLADDGTMLDCAADPATGSLTIACGSVGNNANDFQVWTVTYVGTGGTGCSTTAYTCVIDANTDNSILAPAAGRMHLAATYVTSQGNSRAIVAFSDSTNDSQFDYVTYDGDWNGGTITSFTKTMGQEANMLGATNPYDNSEGLFVLSDSASDLFAVKFTLSGSTLSSASDADDGAALETTLANINGAAFDVAFEPRFPPSKLTQEGYIWENNEGITPETRSVPSGGGTGAGVAWSSTSGVSTSDNLHAQASLLNTNRDSQYLQALSFAFTVPSTATVKGIEVNVERKSSVATDITDLAARIIKGGTIGSADRSTTPSWPTSDEVVKYGSPSDLWGESWTPAEINANSGGGFGFAIRAHYGGSSSANALVDHISATVYYTDADGNSQQAAGNAAITSVKKGERLTLRTHIKNTGVGPLDDNLALFYDRGDGLWSKVKSSTPANTGGGSCSDNLWQCTTIDDPTNTLQNPAVVVNPTTGRLLMAYADNSANATKLAEYVGSNGTGCTNGSSEWTCSTLNDLTGTSMGAVKMAISPSGAPWILAWQGGPTIIRYVGSGGTGCTGATDGAAWECIKIETANATSPDSRAPIAFTSTGQAFVAYEINNNIRVARYVGTNGTGCDAGVTAWSCEMLDDHATATYNADDLVIDNNDTVWISWSNSGGGNNFARSTPGSGAGCNNATNSSFWTCSDMGAQWQLYLDIDNTLVAAIPTNTTIAKYVGSGGSCTQSAAWECTIINSGVTAEGIVLHPSISGLVAVYSVSGQLNWARFVGANGTGCSNSAWTCTTIDTTSVATGQRNQREVTQDANGKLYIAYSGSASNSMKIASQQPGGEIVMSPGLSGANGDSLRESHADMTAVPNDANRDDADCLSGSTTWNNGKIFESEEGSSLNLLAGADTAQCTEVAFTIDTSQAVAGRTYRFVIATNDAWRPDKGQWRGPIAISSGAYATFTIESDTTTRYAKDNTPKFADCSDTAWGCMTVDDPSNNVGGQSAMAFDTEGNPWISYRDSTASTLKAARYVGTGGTGCGGGVTNWTCTTVDSTSGVGQYNSLGFDPAGRAWIAYQDLTGNDSLKIARYVGGGGNCTDTAWSCEYVDTADSAIRYTSIAFDTAGTPWVSYQSDSATPGSTLKVARYVGSGGSCGLSRAWECTTIDDPATNNVGLYTSIAFDAQGNAWISYQDSTALALKVAQYVGGGGNCTSTAWNCATVDNTGTDTGKYTSIAFDASNNPWVSFYDTTNTSLRVATKSASFGSACTDTSWNCGVVDNDISVTTNTGQDSSIAFDAQGNAWVGYYEDFQASCDDSPTTECSLKVARFVGGTGGNCSSTAWSCSTVQSLTGTGDLGKSASIAFDASGSPWVSFYHTTNVAQAVAKLNLPLGQPSGQAKIPYPGRSAKTGDARYRLDRGKSPRTEASTCSAIGDNMGYCGVAADDSYFDSILAVPNERPLYTFATRFTSDSIAPKGTWIGRSNIAPSSSGTTGDLVLQVYRFGSTNGWENVTTDTTSSDCNSADCTLTGTPSGTASEYFEADGSNYWAYYRVWQYENSGNEILKTDSIAVTTNTPPNNPASLAQKKTDDTVIATGEWINETSVKFTASATDPDATDTLQLCVEKDILGTSFSNTEDLCGTGVAYSGSAVTVSVTITGITDANEYHWQARVKDAAGAYSPLWVSYDTNPETARDFGIDTTAPTGGTVFDGTNTGVDEDFNDESLSSLSANWSGFNAGASGLNKYQYSIGTTIGGTDIKGWTDNATTSVTATGLTLNTSQIYYVNVRAVDNAGNTQSPVITSDGQVVAPDLSFSVSPSSITFANLNSGNSYTDTETATLTTSTNAYGGYVVRAFATDALRSTDGTKTIPAFDGGTYASPDSWQGGDTGFGYTTNDADVFPQSGACPGGGTAPCYAPFTTSRPGDIVASHPSNVTGATGPITDEAVVLTYRVTTASIQAAGNYLAAIVYTVTALY